MRAVAVAVAVAAALLAAGAAGTGARAARCRDEECREPISIVRARRAWSGGDAPGAFRFAALDTFAVHAKAGGEW